MRRVCRLRAVSTGLRFTTLPPVLTPGAPPPSPPTTLTLLYNPLIGFLSSAYSAQVSPTVALSTRFGVNIYSYESDLAVGGEWWVGRRRGKRDAPTSPSPPIRSSTPGLNLRGEEEDVVMEKQLDSPFPILRDEEDVSSEKAMDSPIPLVKQRSPVASQNELLKGRVGGPADGEVSGAETDRDGIIKARLSGNWVSLGVFARAGHVEQSVSGSAVRSKNTQLSSLGRGQLGSRRAESYPLCWAGSAVFLVGYANHDTRPGPPRCITDSCCMDNGMDNGMVSPPAALRRVLTHFGHLASLRQLRLICGEYAPAYSLIPLLVS